MDNAMLEAGKYLIKRFYDDDYEKAEKKKFKQNKSLYKLFQKIQNESDGNTPKKTWLYNAIDIAIADKKYNKLSAAYGKLTHSHKIKLIESRLKENVQIELINEAVINKDTVAKLQEKIRVKKNVKPKTTEYKLQLLQKSLQNKFTIDELDKFEYENLKLLKIELDKIMNNIKKRLDVKKPLANKNEKKTKKNTDKTRGTA